MISSTRTPLRPGSPDPVPESAGLSAKPWWLTYAETHEPLIYIGGRDNPYMIRWALVPRNDEANIYLHSYIRDDEDRALHDHPWESTSINLSAHLREIDAEHPEGRLILPGEIRTRSSTYAHRLIVVKRGFTLFMTGPRIREWGFHCEQGWRHWTRFTSGERGEMVGIGCAEFGDPKIEARPRTEAPGTSDARPDRLKSE